MSLEIKQAVDNAVPMAPSSQPPAKPSPPPKLEVVGRAAESWPDPIPFGTGAATPEIPADLLPGVFGRYAESLSQNLQTAPAMAAMYLLAVLSVALQRKFVVGPYPDDGYVEPVNIWVLLLAWSGERKSQVIKWLTRPLIFWERRRLDAEKISLAESETARKVALKRAEKLETTAAAEEDATRRAELAREAAELKAAAPEERHPTQLFTGDVTPEEVQDRLVKNHGRFAVLSDEGGLFAILAGIYSGGEAISDVFLQSYSGQPVRVNRRTRCAIIDKPALTMGLAIQPELIADMPTAAKRKFRSSGLFARFFPVYPTSRIGRRDVRKRVAIPDQLQQEYDNTVIALLDIEPPDDEEVRLTLDDEAREVWLSFAEEVERGQASGGEMDGIRDWGAKLPGGVLRLAALMHIAEYGAGGMDRRIDKITALRAVGLAWLLVDHVRAVFGLIGSDPAVDDAKAVLGWIVENRLATFMRSECHKKFHCRFGKVEDLVAALEILKGRGLIRGPFQIKAKSGGRPGHAYEVNPGVLA